MKTIEWLSTPPEPGDPLIMKRWYGVGIVIYLGSSGSRVYYYSYYRDQNNKITTYKQFGSNHHGSMVRYSADLLSKKEQDLYYEVLNHLEKTGQI